jgi:hypothetical protein
MRISLLSLFILLFSVPLYSQEARGFIVMPQGDTLQALISTKPEDTNKDKVTFTLDTSSVIQQFEPYQLTAFSYNGRLFVSKVIRENNFKRIVFLEAFEIGRISLFKYPLNPSDNEFFVEKDGTISKLVSSKTYIQTDNGQLLKESKEYINILDILTIDCENQNKKVNKLTFQLKSLSSFIKDYNQNCFPQEENRSFNTEVSSQKVILTLEPFLAYNLVFFDIQDNRNFPRSKANSEYGFGIVMHAKLAKASPVTIDLSIAYNNKGARNKEAQYYFDLKYLNFSPTATYYFGKSKTKSFIDGGLIYGTLLNRNKAYNRILSDGTLYNYYHAVVIPTYSEIGFSLGGGIITAISEQKIKLGLRYQYTEIPFHHSDERYKNRIIQFTLGLLLD